MIESHFVELKEELNQSAIREIVAFANTDGGKLYIGINDDGVAVGVPDIRGQVESLSSMIRDGIKPSVLSYIHVSTSTLEGNDVIVVEVQRGDGKPYYLTKKGMKPSGVFVRVGNTSVPVSEHDIRTMIAEYHGMTYESTRSLNQELTFHYARRQFEDRELEFGEIQMKNLHLYDEDGLYNNLGLLLSDQCPHIIKAAIFKGNDKLNFRHRQEFGGSILKQLDDVYQFLEMQNHLTTTYDGLRRVDQYMYSLIALREGLLNSIIHRDYGLNGSVYVNVYKDYIEFVSIGSLPYGLHLEDIYEGVSRPRNEWLANVFYRLQLVEAYGTGVMKILSAYKELDMEPEFKVTPGAFILRLPSFEAKSEEGSGFGNHVVREAKASYVVAERSVSDSGDMDDTSGNRINLKDKEAVKVDIVGQVRLRGFITRAQVQELYGFSQTKSGSLLRELELSGSLVRVARGKNSYYEIR